jgi:hypothetical protein
MARRQVLEAEELAPLPNTATARVVCMHEGNSVSWRMILIHTHTQGHTGTHRHTHAHTHTHKHTRAYTGTHASIRILNGRTADHVNLPKCIGRGRLRLGHTPRRAQKHFQLVLVRVARQELGMCERERERVCVCVCVCVCVFMDVCVCGCV